MLAGLKLVLAAFGCCLILAGVALIAVGSYVHVQLLAYSAFYAGRLGTPIILIVMGVLSFPLCGLLAVALLRDGPRPLGLFCALLGAVVACEIGAAIASFEYRHVIGGHLKAAVLRDLDACQGTGLVGVQSALRCCGGPNGEYDYRARGLPVPESCCPYYGCRGYGVYRASCNGRLEHHFRYNMVSVGATAIVFLCIHFAGLLLACWYAYMLCTDNSLIYTVNQ
ncbi:unnamed protein product [Ixodes hexagonus]